jgi:hypothetical protein
VFAGGERGIDGGRENETESMLAEHSTPESDWDADEAEAIDLRMPAWLVSALVHGLVILALPLFELPPFAHRRPTQLDVSSLAADPTGDVPITQVVLSLRQPDQPQADVTEMFAANLANVAGAGGRGGAVEPVELEGPEAHLAPSSSSGIETGSSQFDAAGTRNASAEPSDTQLLIPDSRETQVTEFMPEDLTGSVASGLENEVIAKALRWIVSRQSSGGSWDAGSSKSQEIGSTSLALLSLLAMGQTHQSGRYQSQVAAAIASLLDHETTPLAREQEAQRALILCEFLLATRDPKLRDAAQSAVKKVIATNYDPNTTNWYGMGVFSGPLRAQRYRPPGTADWAWQIWAIYAGELAGLQDNTNVLPTLRGHCLTTDESALAGLAYSTYDLRDSVLVGGATEMARIGPATQGERQRCCDYYTSLVLARTGNTAAEDFQQQLSEHLLQKQLKLGPDVGSWRPEHQLDTPLTATIFATLILAAPSETTAIHKRPAAWR